MFCDESTFLTVIFFELLVTDTLSLFSFTLNIFFILPAVSHVLTYVLCGSRVSFLVAAQA